MDLKNSNEFMYEFNLDELLSSPLPNVPAKAEPKLRGAKNLRLAERIADTDKLVRQLKQLQEENRQYADLQRTACEVTKLYQQEKKQRMKQERRANELNDKLAEVEKELDAQQLTCEQLQDELKENTLPVAVKDVTSLYMQLAQRISSENGASALKRREQTMLRALSEHYKIDYSKIYQTASPSKNSPGKKSPKTKKTSSCSISSSSAATQTEEAWPVVKLEPTTCSIGVQCEQLNPKQTRDQGTQHKNPTITRGTTMAQFSRHDVGTSFPEPKPPPNVDQMLAEMLSWSQLPLSPINDPPANATSSVGTCTTLCNVRQEIDFVSSMPAQIKTSNSRPPSRGSVKTEGVNPEPPAVPINFPPQFANGLRIEQPLGEVLEDMIQLVGIFVRQWVQSSTRPYMSSDFVNWVDANLLQAKPMADSNNDCGNVTNPAAAHMDVGTDPMVSRLKRIRLPPKPKPKPARKRRAVCESQTQTPAKRIARLKKTPQPAKILPETPPQTPPETLLEAPLETPPETSLELPPTATETAIHFVSNLIAFSQPNCDNLAAELNPEELRYLRQLEAAIEEKHQPAEVEAEVEVPKVDEAEAEVEPEIQPLAELDSSPPVEPLSENCEKQLTKTEANPMADESVEAVEHDLNAEQAKMEGNWRLNLFGSDAETEESEVEVEEPKADEAEAEVEPEPEIQPQAELDSSPQQLAKTEAGPITIKSVEAVEHDLNAEPPKIEGNWKLNLFGSDSEAEEEADRDCAESPKSGNLVIDEENEEKAEVETDNNVCEIAAQSLELEPQATPSPSGYKRKRKATEKAEMEPSPMRLTRQRAKQLQLEAKPEMEPEIKPVDCQEQLINDTHDAKSIPQLQPIKEINSMAIICCSESPASPAAAPPSSSEDEDYIAPLEIPLQRASSWTRQPKALLFHLTDAAKQQAKANPKSKPPTNKQMEKQLQAVIQKYLKEAVELESSQSDLIAALYIISSDDGIIIEALLTTYGRIEPQNEDDSSLWRLLTLLRFWESSQSNFISRCMLALEQRLFQLRDKPPRALAHKYIKLYLKLIAENQAGGAADNPARLLLAKILYHYNNDMTLLVLEVVSQYPSVLPHREDRSYDHADPLITVIKHLLMCHKYDMSDAQSPDRLLLSKLRFEYHFQPFEPNKQQVLDNLIEKLKAGKLKELCYAFALFSRRCGMLKPIEELVDAQLLPLASGYCDLCLQSAEYDERMVELLRCVSMIVKQLPLESTNITTYIALFKRLLMSAPRPGVQQAALQAILRLQRFGWSHALDALQDYRPNYELEPMTRAMLRSFVERWRQYQTGGFNKK